MSCPPRVSVLLTGHFVISVWDTDEEQALVVVGVSSLDRGIVFGSERGISGQKE